jgi:hypothetical protein
MDEMVQVIVETGFTFPFNETGSEMEHLTTLLTHVDQPTHGQPERRQSPFFWPHSVRATMEKILASWIDDRIDRRVTEQN